jgi:hypothetical protein
MELVFALIGFIAGVVGMVSAMRRANKKPEGNTAKVVKMVAGGGGPDPRVP